MITVLNLIEMSKIIEGWQEDLNSCSIGAYYRSQIKSKLKEAKSAIDDYITSVEGFL